MTTTSASAAASPPSYINNKSGLMSWLLTTDHKRIGILYLIGMSIFFIFAMAMALLFRLELFSEGVQFIPSDLYNRMLTLHGVSMIFLFVIPGIPAVFGNFFLPIMIGAEDVSFPRLNLFSWYCYAAGGLLALASVFLGGPDTGWTFYVPYSMKTEHNVLVPLAAAFILGWSSIRTGINFVTTVHRLKAKSMGFFDMPLFVWATYATGWIQILATPVVGITLIMVLLDRFASIPIFDPSRGGDPGFLECGTDPARPRDSRLAGNPRNRDDDSQHARPLVREHHAGPDYQR